MTAPRPCIFSALALALALGLAPADADPAAQRIESFRDWQVVCIAGDEDCAMVQARIDGAGQVVVLANLAPDGAGGMVGRLRAPHGLRIAAGLGLQVDERPPWPAAEFSHCRPEGCIAPLRLDPAQVAVARRGAALWVSGTVHADGRPVVWRLSLLGFTAARARLEALHPEGR